MCRTFAAAVAAPVPAACCPCRPQDTSYLLYPRINVTVCDTIHDDVGPTVAGAAAGAALASARGLSQVLLGSAVSAAQRK